MYVGLATTIYVRCVYGIFGREITKYTVVYDAYTRFWPALHIHVVFMFDTLFRPGYKMCPFDSAQENREVTHREVTLFCI